MKHNMQILRESCAKNGPLCVGLDTDPSYLPPEVLALYKSPAEAVLAYNRGIIEQLGDRAGCCKVQIAYYEAMGLSGLQTYAETLKLLKKHKIPCISDVKRGDIADTAKAYARAHFSGDFETDIITVNPYMGFDTLKPFTEWCTPEKGGKGIFVLLRTSNPGMQDLENQNLSTGGVLLDRVGAELNRIADEMKPLFDKGCCSPVGAVVGCTEEANAQALRKAYPDVFFLIPGYGAQGGQARIAATLLGEAGGTVNSSRGILCAWKKDASLEEKRAKNALTLDDVVQSSLRAADAAKKDLLGAKAELGL